MPVNTRSGLFFIVLILLAAGAFAQTPKSETEFKKYFTANAATLDTIEGIWTVSTSQESYNYDTLYDIKTFTKQVAVMKKDTVFKSYDLKGAPFNVHFSRTKVNKVYLFKIFFKETDTNTNADAVISAGRKMEYSYEFPEDYLRFVFSETYEKGDRVVNKVTWTKIFP